MDKKGFKDFLRKYSLYLDSEEGKLEYLSQIYQLLNQWDIMQEFMIMETKNSTVH